MNKTLLVLLASFVSMLSMTTIARSGYLISQLTDNEYQELDFILNNKNEIILIIAGCLMSSALMFLRFKIQSIKILEQGS